MFSGNHGVLRVFATPSAKSSNFPRVFATPGQKIAIFLVFFKAGTEKPRVFEPPGAKTTCFLGKNQP